MVSDQKRMTPFCIETTSLMVERASENAKKINMAIAQGRTSRSITKGDGAFAGCLIEEGYLLALSSAQRANSYGKDFIYKGKRVESKGKRRTNNRPPRPNYEASIAFDSTNYQHPDFYVHGSVLWVKEETELILQYPRMWLMGGLSLKETKDKWRQVEKGAIEENNKWKCDGKCYNLYYNQLKRINLRIDNEAYLSKIVTPCENNFS